ncbi:glucose-1-phosphate cytidylyltransferase [Clostridium sp. YIM B02551]|uniref:glucose-1-phosphate cytidylyltransferase n=1 Tax=Clostridium sp. YIM B02551 TaxID=2910679 RepID=UPI001EEA267F|nr:glucose-1-phosphate cytidylyltransferase [Clostridium sp. YIM B02551]
MKVVILCGGKSTRMHELTRDIPKPLVEIGGKPILWHIMKLYKHYGFDDFVLLLGYKGEKIKEYFLNYRWKNHNFILDSDPNNIQILEEAEKWKITFVDTGLDTMTGGRIKLAQRYIGNETFMLTYGDGLSDINLNKLLEFHKNTGAIATVTGIYKKSQYGTLTVNGGIAKSFYEKNQTGDLINGGFFVMNPEVFDYLSNSPSCILEQEPLRNLVNDQELAVYIHQGFWTAMDTAKDISTVNEMWSQGNHLWKVW